jgi:3-hydroxyisobutyrate dehydrogenase
MPKQMTVAVLGAGGTMGLPMARNIARAGLRVRAWNRSPEKMRPLADDGAHLADDARAAVEGADVVITMLADADAVLAVMGAAIDAMREGVAWLQTSTIGEAGIEACAELAEGHGIRLVDAPVLGTKAPAEQGELIVLGSGPEGLRDGLAPIFDAIAQRTMWVGETGAGTRLKVVVNSWIVTVVEGGAETIALAEGMGVDPTLLFEALEGGALDLPYLRMKGEAIAARDFDPSFSLRLAAKDMSATFLTSAPGAVR